MKGGKSGAGGRASERTTDTVEEKWKLKSKLQSGDIIGSYFKRGLPPAGKAGKRFKRDVSQASREAQDAMSQEGIPSEYRRLVKKYFDSLQKIYEPDKEKDE